MIILLTIIHVLVCLLLILAVLLQSGKGGGLASALGGGLASSSVLGGRSAATFLSKATTVLATVFMISCLVQAMMVRQSTIEPTTATERMLEEQGAPPIAPPPFVETPRALPGEGAAGAAGEATAPAGQGAAPAADQEQAGGETQE